MKTLLKNTYKIILVEFKSKKEFKDKMGYSTGEYILTYNKPIEVLGSITTARGQAINEVYGTDLNYDFIILFHKKIKVTENDLIFLDKEPNYNPETEEVTNKDYIIKKISRSKNAISVAIKKID